jgi:hypothetical protein
MNRWIVFIGCALAVALATLIGSQAQADGAPRKVYRQAQCVVPARLWMSRTAWSCRRDQKCCYDYALRKGTCVAAADRCI